MTLDLVEAAAQQRVLAYDRAGDGHYGTCRAFIKSMRGNDPDAALYWLATMVAAGEDPRFIVRRIVICASEDVGNADPRALQVAVAAAHALELVGLPEAQYAPRAGGGVCRERTQVEPRRLRLLGGHGGCRSPTARSRCRRICSTPPSRACARMASAWATATPTTTRARTWSSSTCPTPLADRRYYVPTGEGMERLIGERLERIREARTTGAPSKARSTGPAVDHMQVARGVTKAREAAKDRGGGSPATE